MGAATRGRHATLRPCACRVHHAAFGNFIDHLVAVNNDELTSRASCQRAELVMPVCRDMFILPVISKLDAVSLSLLLATA